MMAGRTVVFRQRSFLLVVGGEGLSMIGDSAFTVALAWAVVQSTGSIAALAGILLFQAVPRGVLLLLGGATVDRYSPRVVMLVCHVVRGAVLVAFVMLDVSGTPAVWQLSALALVMGMSEAFFIPASESVLPSLVPEEQLDRAIAGRGFLEQVAFIVGPVLGGLLVAGIDAWAAFLADAVTFAVAAGTILAAPRGVRSGDDDATSTAGQIIWQIGEGLGHARRSSEVRLVLLVISAAALSYSGVFAVGLPALATRFGDASSLGLMVAGWGAGQLLGALAASLTGLPRRWGLLIIGMTLVEGIMFTALGLVPGAWLAASLLFVVGIGVAYSSDVALPTFIQTQTPRHLLGRISAVMELPRVMLEPVSIALLGLALTRSIRWGFAIAALPVLVAGAALALNPQARRLSARPQTDSKDAAGPPPADHQAETLSVVAGVPTDAASRGETRGVDGAR